MELKTQPSEFLLNETLVVHNLDLPQCCPVSGNPQPGSTIEIAYRAKDCFLEVYSLRGYLDSYRGGRGPVRSMEGMIQAITRDCAEILGAFVETKASLILEPSQRMVVTCKTAPGYTYLTQFAHKATALRPNSDDARER